MDLQNKGRFVELFCCKTFYVILRQMKDDEMFLISCWSGHFHKKIKNKHVLPNQVTAIHHMWKVTVYCTCIVLSVLFSPSAFAVVNMFATGLLLCKFTLNIVVLTHSDWYLCLRQSLCDVLLIDLRRASIGRRLWSPFTDASVAGTCPTHCRGNLCAVICYDSIFFFAASPLAVKFNGLL